ncbi:hypothetical protein GWN63_01250 [Candidatus Bathyarchaeota archaeon]|nr:hypothetical protein [Candidatus Bathyarchaeota archaeon]NIU80863.1 hypothetical protein [Candidatus Bathyarchaeota archaeon]NIV67504.1 hypothetical protein [Candidatus Bathyarchaeota archaeon]NIW34109.1 hypothetical protein [Candidatus Bathyarchaeota archaeon]
MNFKAVLMLYLILLALASTITATMAFDEGTPDVSTVGQGLTLTVNSGVEPDGDDVDDPVFPC